MCIWRFWSVGIVLVAVGCGAPPDLQTIPRTASPRLAAAAVGEWEEWYFRADDGCTLYVKELGRGIPLLILHGGWGAEHSYLLDAFDGLKSDYRLIFYDQRGSLRSPCPDAPISIQQHVEDLEGLRAELGLARPILVGHSMGTFLGMSYLEQYPERVGGLVLLGSILPSTPRDEEEARLYREQQSAFVSFAQAAEERQVKREGLDQDNLTDKERTWKWRIGFASGNIYHIKRWRQVMGGMVFYNAEAGRAAGETMPDEWNFLPALGDFDGPVTVIHGDHDLTGFGGALHQRMLEGLPNVEFKLIAEAGHTAWVDQPEQFREALVRALLKYRE